MDRFKAAQFFVRELQSPDLQNPIQRYRPELYLPGSSPELVNEFQETIYPMFGAMEKDSRTWLDEKSELSIFTVAGQEPGNTNPRWANSGEWAEFVGPEIPLKKGEWAEFVGPKIPLKKDARDFGEVLNQIPALPLFWIAFLAFRWDRADSAERTLLRSSIGPVFDEMKEGDILALSNIWQKDIPANMTQDMVKERVRKKVERRVKNVLFNAQIDRPWFVKLKKWFPDFLLVLRPPLPR